MQQLSSVQQGRLVLAFSYDLFLADNQVHAEMLWIRYALSEKFYGPAVTKMEWSFFPHPLRWLPREYLGGKDSSVISKLDKV